jgi:hypothetical protein
MLETITELRIPERAVKSERTELTVFVANITGLRIFIRVGIKDIVPTQCYP